VNETSLRLTRVIPAPIEAVFQAWIDPALMSHWFFVQETWTAEVENDLRVGGEFVIKMHTDGGETFTCSGVYYEIEPPTRLVFSWTSYAVTESRVTIELRDVEGGTELTLTHEDLVDAIARNAHGEGWGGCLASLELFFARTA